MSIDTIIAHLSTNHASYGISLFSPSSNQQIDEFETDLNLKLPDDIRRF